MTTSRPLPSLRAYAPGSGTSGWRTTRHPQERESHPSEWPRHRLAQRTDQHPLAHLVPAGRTSTNLHADGYTLWAYSHVFKGMVLDITL